ncbi:MAG: hypothetical protein AAF623_00670 [Planctomycetota bacterium]
MSIAQETPIDAGPEIDRFITRLVLENIPHDFEEDKDWGNQIERWDGIRLRREGLKLETKRRKKWVNHGTWKKYSVSLLDPENEFDVQLKNMRNIDDGKKMKFDVQFSAYLALAARQSKWVKGVQLYSISAEGTAKVQLLVSMDLAVRSDFSTLPPAMELKPVATSADLEVIEFRIDRVSKLGGEFAQQLTRATRSILDQKVNEKEAKLVQKINKAIQKEKDKLKLSLSELASSRWNKVVQSFLNQ